MKLKTFRVADWRGKARRALRKAGGPGGSHFDPNEPRDEGGKWTEGGGGGGAGAKPQQKPAASAESEAAAREAREDYKKNGTRAKAFKEWFGDWEADPAGASKVVDGEGKPKVVYHGTGKAFDEFKQDTKNAWSDALGFDTYFNSADKATASTYANQSATGKVLENYLSIKKPLEIDVNGGEWMEAIDQAVDQLETYRTPEEKHYMDVKTAYYAKYSYEAEHEPDNIPSEATQELEDARRKLEDHIQANTKLYRDAKRQPYGYDGIIVKNVLDMTAAGVSEEIAEYNPYTTVYVAFRPTQIKSTDNAGTFDPASPKLRKAARFTWTWPRTVIVPRLKTFDPSEARDESGKWTGGGGGGGSGGTATAAPAPRSAAGNPAHDHILTAGITAAQGIVSRVGGAVSNLIDRIPTVGAAKRGLAKTLKAFRAGLAARYGDKMANVILASGATLDVGAHGAAAAMGIPLYIPGATIIGSIPALVLAEGCLQARKLFGRKAMEGGRTLSLVEIHAEAKKLVKALQDEFGKWVKENGDVLGVRSVRNGTGEKAFNPSEPRDETGKWTEGGGSGESVRDRAAENLLKPSGESATRKPSPSGSALPTDEELADAKVEKVQASGAVHGEGGLSKVTTADGREFFHKQASTSEAKRESSASELASIAGVRVPASKQAAVNGKEGVLSEWADGKPGDKDKAAFLAAVKDDPKAASMHALFNFVAGAEDRHAGNYLVTKDGIASIDHSDTLTAKSPSEAAELMGQDDLLAVMQKIQGGADVKFDIAAVREIADKVDDMAEALRKKDMAKEADALEKRGKVVKLLAKDTAPTEAKLRKLATKGAKGFPSWRITALASLRKASTFDPSEPRDNTGKWTTGGAGGGAGAGGDKPPTASAKPPPATPATPESIQQFADAALQAMREVHAKYGNRTGFGTRIMAVMRDHIAKLDRMVAGVKDKTTLKRAQEARDRISAYARVYV